jgi:hypothetical protein
LQQSNFLDIFIWIDRKVAIPIDNHFAIMRLFYSGVNYEY